jgi:hypothetical protein
MPDRVSTLLNGPTAKPSPDVVTDRQSLFLSTGGCHGGLSFAVNGASSDAAKVSSRR